MDSLNQPICLGITRDSLIVHAGNKSKGFHDKPMETGTRLMLIVSELGEALESDRIGRHASPELFEREQEAGSSFEASFKLHIKDTFEDEMADAVIRIMDTCGALGINLEWHINQKLKYNAGRPTKHGKEY